jgi:hypothetical protein
MKRIITAVIIAATIAIAIGIFGAQAVQPAHAQTCASAGASVRGSSAAISAATNETAACAGFGFEQGLLALPRPG